MGEMVSMGGWVASRFESAGIGRVLEVRLKRSDEYTVFELFGIPVSEHSVVVRYIKPGGGSESEVGAGISL